MKFHKFYLVRSLFLFFFSSPKLAVSAYQPKWILFTTTTNVAHMDGELIKILLKILKILHTNCFLNQIKFNPKKKKGKERKGKWNNISIKINIENTATNDSQRITIDCWRSLKPKIINKMIIKFFPHFFNSKLFV